MDYRLQMISALEWLYEEPNAGQLQLYLSQGEDKEYQAAHELWQQFPKEGRRPFLTNQLKALQSKEDFSGVVDIHPAWLLKPLECESPRVIGVILRHLPSKHVRYLLEHLPRNITVRLPKLMESFYVSSEILTLVRRRFERHFHPLHLSRSLGTYDFEHVHYLKSEEVTRLIRDLGLSELALAMIKATKRVVHVVLNRLSIKDAKTAVQRIKEYQGITPIFSREARYTVLEMTEKAIGVELFLRELGVAAFSKAFDPNQDNLFKAISQKMSPEEAYLLKRYIDHYVPAAEAVAVERRRQWVLNHVVRLSQEGLLDAEWAEVNARDAA